MPPIPRRFGDPVDRLPRTRNSINDRHHLFWPGADVRRKGLGDFRSVGCTSAAKLDSMVHSVVHQRFSGILPLPAEALSDLRRRANACLERHFTRRCACWNVARLCTVDALSLEACAPHMFDGPPCSAILVDGQVYELMRDFYATAAPITDALRQQLQDRCDQCMCACMVQRGAHRLRQPTIWMQYELRAV